jgi:tetratricopeptide (TPR) repeat protein
LPPDIQFVINPIIGTNGRVPKAAQPRPTEQMFLHIWALTEEEEPASEEELEELLSRHLTPFQKPSFPEPTQPWHKAQNLAYEGWTKRSARRREKAARQALSISPDAVDAYLLLAHDAASWEEAAQLCTQAVAAAERLLGPDPFTAYKDGFWGVAITRPYMRARFALGYALWRQGNHAEAQVEFENLLRLNPGDNQGARYVLVAVLLEHGKDKEARRVMDRYSPDALSHWAYNQALLRFRQRGDHPQARRRLSRALSLNPYVPPLLLGERRIRSQELQFVAPGEENEAIEYAQLYKNAWAMTPGALEWLGRGGAP